jgi:hypothetical protein
VFVLGDEDGVSVGENGVEVSIGITSVPASRDAPRRETNHRYFEFKRL